MMGSKFRTLSTMGSGLALLGALLACKGGSKEGAPTASASAATSANAPIGDGPLTLEQYEQLILALSKCKAMESESTYYGWVDGACPEYKTFNAARSKKDAMKDIGGKTGPLARKLITNPSPAVRVQATGMVGTFFGMGSDNQSALLTAAKQEKDPAVLKTILNTIANEGKKNPAVGEFILAMTKHENPRIRATAAVSLASSWNKGMPGAVPRFIELMEKDTDPKVRQATCAYAGAHADDALIPTYTKLTDPKADQDLAAECYKGLLSMWASWPLWQNANEKAYKLTLKLFFQKPRTAKTPPWYVVSNFEYLGKGEGRSFEEWKGKAKWVDNKALKRAMLELVGDKNVNWLGRTAAVKAAVALGTTKAELEAIKKKLAPGSPDSHVASQIEKSLADAK